MKPLRILTWNIHGVSVWDRNERFPIIKNALETYRPDIACIQEAFFPKSRKMLREIEGYHASYQTNYFPPLTTKGGLVTLTKTEPLESHYHPYLAQGNILTEQRWDRLVGKGFLETMLEDAELGKITVINTHNVCTYTKEMDQYLEAQAGQLLQKIRRCKEKGGFVVVAGDFNFKRRSELYPQFKELLHDATEGLEHFHWFEYETVDYILVGGKYYCEPVYVHHESWPKYPSDHPGIMVEVKL